MLIENKRIYDIGIIFPAEMSQQLQPCSSLVKFCFRALPLSWPQQRKAQSGQGNTACPKDAYWEQPHGPWSKLLKGGYIGEYMGDYYRGWPGSPGLLQSGTNSVQVAAFSAKNFSILSREYGNIL